MEPQSKIDENIESPGVKLKRARINLGLSVSDVASELRLSSSQIEALESDNYESLPGETYVRGYLCGYSRLLNLETDEVLSGYRRTVAQPDAEPTEFVGASVARQARSGDRGMKLVGILVLGGLLGLAATWWQGREQAEQWPLSPQTQSATTEATVSTAAESQAIETISPAAESDPEFSDSKDKQVSAAIQPAVQAAPVSPPTPVTPPTPPRKTVPKTVPGKSKIVLTFQQDSWADVRDSAKGKLLYRTVSQGRAITLDGKPPFRIFLGNAAGVKIRYNGKNIDVGAYQQGVYARFTLGE